MLQIIKQKNADNYLAEIKDLGLDPSFIRISEAVEGDKVSGHCIYEFNRGEVIIHSIHPLKEDLLLFDGIARSVLFLGVTNGIEKACFKGDTVPSAVLLKLCDENGILSPVSPVFNTCKHCANNPENKQ